MHGHVVKHYDKKRVSQPALRTFLLDLYPRQVSGSPQHRTWEIKIPFDASMSVRLLPKWIKWACTDGLFHVSCSFQILGTKMPKKTKIRPPSWRTGISLFHFKVRGSTGFEDMLVFWSVLMMGDDDDGNDGSFFYCRFQYID